MATEYYQANVRWICAGQPAEIVLHYRIIDPSVSDEWLVAGQLVNALEEFTAPTDWLKRLANLISQQCFLSSIRAKRVAPTGGNTAVGVYETTDVPGAVADDIDTQQIAACIIWTNEVSPQKTGRNFIMGVADQEVDQSRWTDDFLSRVALFVAKHLTGFSVAAGTFEPVIFDRLTKTGPLMTDGYLSPKIGTQRRREVPI